jgi:AcrR family transcriptional regulator
MSAQKTPTRRYQLRKRAEAMEATRRRITVAAMELHETLGPARTTLTAVAERAGVQRQTVYRHFADEKELLAACSGHYAALHPLPDAGRWAAIADPAERLGAALDELYAWYEDTEPMWTNVFRDETLVDAVGPALEPLRAYLDDAARTLAAGWGAPGPRRATLLAAARHAVDFHTWRSLAHDGGVSRAGVVELTSAMVSRAAAA